MERHIVNRTHDTEHRFKGLGTLPPMNNKSRNL